MLQKHVVFTEKLHAKVSFQLWWGFTCVCRKVSLAWVRCCHSFLWPLMGKLIRVSHAKLGFDGWSALDSSGSSWEFTIAADLQPLYLKIDSSRLPVFCALVINIIKSFLIHILRVVLISFCACCPFSFTLGNDLPVLSVRLRSFYFPKETFVEYIVDFSWS